MKWTQTPIHTLRSAPAGASLKSHVLLLRSGLIHPVASGLFTYGPFMVRALQKFENIIRKELDQQGCVEIYMPMVQPKKLWDETGRWEDFSEILQKMKNRNKQEFCLGPTHEEMVTDYIRSQVKSYRDLPFTVYQIQTKYRDEFRPRYGLLRAREFSMKDAYSFDLDEPAAHRSFKKMEKVYHNIFSRLDVPYCVVQADSGSMGGSLSKEFHILSDEGESSLLISEDGQWAIDKEIAEKHPRPAGPVKECKGIECGHIFYLGTKYSKTMNASYLNQNGKKQWIEMGCYGIGISRVVQAVVEQSHDDQGFVWPTSLAPFAVHLINIHSSDKVCRAIEEIYQQLKSKKYR